MAKLDMQIITSNDVWKGRANVEQFLKEQPTS